jgi:hypothetical protein
VHNSWVIVVKLSSVVFQVFHGIPIPGIPGIPGILEFQVFWYSRY